MYKAIRICKYCGKTFTPEHGRQIFCCTECRNAYGYQARRLQRAAHRQVMSIEDTRAALANKSHLSITETAAYLGVTRPTVYARIREGELVPVRFATRTLRIPIEQLIADTEMKIQASKGDFSSLISKEAALARYEITDTWLYKRCKSEGIRPKIIKGRAFFPKKDLDRLFPPKVTYSAEDWYNAEELMKSEGLTRKYITNLVRTKNIPHSRQGKVLLIAKKEWNQARLFRGDMEKNYMTVDQATKHYHLGNKTFYDKINEAGIKGVRQNRSVYFLISDLDRLFKDKTPKIPPEIRRDYIRSCDALKKYHIGQKRFSEETRAAGVTKVRTEGNFVWYKKSELDELFNKISDHESR